MTVQDHGCRLGSSVYLGSYQKTRPTVGINTLTPKEKKRIHLATGLIKADLTVKTMQAIVNIVISVIKMYR